MAIIQIPLELKANYLRDPENFLRDIACVPTESTRPFIKDKGKIAFVEKNAHENPFNEDKRSFIEGYGPADGTIQFARYMHIDYKALPLFNSILYFQSIQSILRL